MEFSLKRFDNIVRQKFECEIVTPMFLGGANTKEAELRAASIKGVLRFWWRALYGSNDLNRMKEKESEIFGSTEEQSKLAIKISGAGLKPESRNLPRPKEAVFKVKGHSLSIIDYLAYGLYEYKRGQGNVYNKEYFKPMAKFEIILSFPKEFENEILTSFEVLIKFGGLGSRSRNGFGSLYSKDIENIECSELFKGKLLKYTAFSNESKLFLFNEHNSWESALSEIGFIYREARLSLENKHVFDKRALVAMPIEVKGENIPEEIKKGRHAKPYFLHVNKLKNGKFQGQILFLPYNYSDAGVFKYNRNKEYKEVQEKIIGYFSKKAKEVIE